MTERTRLSMGPSITGAISVVANKAAPNPDSAQATNRPRAMTSNVTLISNRRVRSDAQALYVEGDVDRPRLLEGQDSRRMSSPSARAP